MELSTHETIRVISKRMFSFISAPHEGLGIEEQARLLADCTVLNGIANDIEDGKELK
tara:strand:+ start:272 stop:442 length:171 start_codon:yes stop_codon:yes gene_type:complete